MERRLFGAGGHIGTGSLALRWVTATLVALLCAAPPFASAQDQGTSAGSDPLQQVAAAEAGFSQPRLDSLSAALRRYVDEGALAGSVLLVARDGALVYQEAFGWRDREARDDMEVDDLFRIASQTKAIVSAAVIVLQERGRLLINEPVSEYLPEFANTGVAVAKEGGGYDVVPAARRITIRDLLTHTAGIGYGWGVAQEAWEEAGILGWYFADREEMMADVVSRMATLPMNAHPGTTWVYGYAVDILGVVVEKVSGMSLAEFLRSEILEPLGMFDTYFYVPADDGDRLAVVYAHTDDGLERAPDVGTMEAQGHYLVGPRAAYSGGAGLVSTAMDYARFLQMMLNGGELDGVRILSPSSVELMTTNHLREDIDYRAGEGFGLGFSVVTELGLRGLPGSVGEYGWGGAYHSVYWVDPVEKLVVVYLTQLIPAGPIDDHLVVRAMVYGSMVE
jgi:CubicO group peptidase (beta-lactamase class C family)